MTGAPRTGRPTLIRRSAAAAVTARRTRTAQVRRRRRQVVLWLVLAVLASAVAFAAGLVEAPLNYRFVPTAPTSVLLLDSSGQVFATVRSPQVQVPVSGRQIPPVMRQAIVAAEDKNFYSGAAIDPLAILRAAWLDITGHGLQGGSTITQQYVKTVYTGQEQTALRKLREASLALRLEQHLTKDQILTRYLNTLYLGNGTAGVEAASEFYFGVPISQLDYDPASHTHSSTLALARAATLAGIAPAPSAWNPIADPQQARARELYVLNQMLRARDITSQQAGAAYGHSLPPIVAKAEPEAATIAPEFRDLVAAQLQKYGDSTLFASGGMQVKTTLNLDLQQAAVDALHTLPKQPGLDAAIVAVDPRNGDLRAMTERKAGGYVRNGENLADPPAHDITRSSGSTIKPFTLAVALEHGHTLSESHYAPECVQITAQYRPCNAEGGAGYYSLESALQDSINTVYAPLGVQVGLRRVVRLARRSGMQIGHLDSGRTCGEKHHRLCPSYALGVPVSPLSEASAYGTLVDHGVHHPVRAVLGVQTKSQGSLFAASNAPSGRRVMPAQIAGEVTSAMQGVVDHGTGVAARQPFPVYGKTGTTDNFTDAWFTGCTHTLCITVWLGYDKPYLHHGKVPHSLRTSTGAPVYGGTLPAQLFARTYSNYRSLSTTLVTPSPTTTYSPPSPTATALPSPSQSSTRPGKPSRSGTPSPSHPATASPTSSGSSRPRRH
ncbi:MAG TPA: transglycosylase domain-containing protein [Mycobacteriales bacterium]|nr:transglycosylase domain-containing protein [Mycobacteriales bacterium]